MQLVRDNLVRVCDQVADFRVRDQVRHTLLVLWEIWVAESIGVKLIMEDLS